MLRTIPLLNFDDALRVLTDDYTPPGAPYLERSPIPKQWVIIAPQTQCVITEDTFRELLDAQCVVADKEHFIPTAYAREFVKTLT
jgi:hypothetical protein